MNSLPQTVVMAIGLHIFKWDLEEGLSIAINHANKISKKANGNLYGNVNCATGHSNDPDQNAYTATFCSTNGSFFSWQKHLLMGKEMQFRIITEDRVKPR